jgi:hypothetical protein
MSERSLREIQASNSVPANAAFQTKTAQRLLRH